MFKARQKQGGVFLILYPLIVVLLRSSYGTWRCPPTPSTRQPGPWGRCSTPGSGTGSLPAPRGTRTCGRGGHHPHVEFCASAANVASVSGGDGRSLCTVWPWHRLFSVAQITFLNPKLCSVPDKIFPRRIYGIWEWTGHRRCLLIFVHSESRF